MTLVAENQSGIERLTELLAGAQRIVFLTGAGMSTESGIPDFRSATGIYATVTSEEIFDIQTFRRNARRFYKFAQGFFGEIRQASPNEGHRAIARLEHEFGKDVAVSTQNIDTLHQDAGNGNVFPVHGTVETCTCLRCGAARRSSDIWETVTNGELPYHECGGLFKPDIVFFGEVLPADMLFASQHAIGQADLLVICGTSLTVYPAAALPSMRRSDCPMVIINRTSTARDADAQLVLHESIGPVLAAAVAKLAEQSPPLSDLSGPPGS